MWEPSSSFVLYQGKLRHLGLESKALWELSKPSLIHMLSWGEVSIWKNRCIFHLRPHPMEGTAIWDSKITLLYLRGVVRAKKKDQDEYQPLPQAPKHLSIALGNGVGSFSFETPKTKVAQLRGWPKLHSSQVAGPERGPLLSCLSAFPSHMVPSQVTVLVSGHRQGTPLWHREHSTGSHKSLWVLLQTHLASNTSFTPPCEWCHPRQFT